MNFKIASVALCLFLALSLDADARRPKPKPPEPPKPSEPTIENSRPMTIEEILNRSDDENTFMTYHSLIMEKKHANKRQL